jgi:Rrf2 family protein
MISQTGKHALHVLGYLAENPGKCISGQDIAKTINVPANYLGKILNQLAKHSFVESRKGWGGGFTIVETSLDRTIAEVLNIIQGPASTIKKECVFGLGECSDDQPCPLHETYKPIRAAYEDMLQKITVGSLSLKK